MKPKDISDEIYNNLFAGIGRAGYVSPKAKRMIRSKAEIVKFLRNQIVLEKGEVCRYCYFLISGALRAYFEKRGKDVTAWFMVTGDVAIGVTSFYTQKPSKEFIVAMEDTICVRLSYEDLQLIPESSSGTEKSLHSPSKRHGSWLMVPFSPKRKGIYAALPSNTLNFKSCLICST
ncbi:cyclic nucleotide-binding domain-containing protein [Chitinophaga niabensis]|uniref:Crp/Fnr family transcriptional regulator n=1 Tax=Chitinophaga niabensis TaxID=536979 RepID=UPI0031BB0958